MKTTKEITPETLAKEFSSILASWASGDERRQIVELNAAEENPSICHSHDFYDANQAMIEALENLGSELDIQDDDQGHLITNAWYIAKQNKFWFQFEN